VSDEVEDMRFELSNDALDGLEFRVDDRLVHVDARGLGKGLEILDDLMALERIEVGIDGVTVDDEVFELLVRRPGGGSPLGASGTQRVRMRLSRARRNSCLSWGMYRNSQG
jgi:hypothetical protein